MTTGIAEEPGKPVIETNTINSQSHLKLRDARPVDRSSDRAWE